MQYSQQQILALDPCGTSSLNKLTSREAEAGSYIAIQFSCNTKAKQSKEKKNKQRNSSALDKYSKLRFFWRLGWRGTATGLLYSMHCTAMGCSHYLCVPRETHHCSKLRGYTGFTNSSGDCGSQHIPKSSDTQAPAFWYQPCPSCPSHKKPFKPHVLYQARSICYRNNHRNTVFSAAWYMMLADTRWRWKDKISREITKLRCSRSGKINIQTLSYITTDPKWKFYHSLATAWYDLHWLSDPLQQSRFEI